MCVGLRLDRTRESRLGLSLDRGTLFHHLLSTLIQPHPLVYPDHVTSDSFSRLILALEDFEVSHLRIIRSKT